MSTPPPPNVPGLSLKGRALRLLAAREHSRAELARKLAAFEPDPEAVARTLDELQARDFINEQRVVESLLHRRADKLGALRLRAELQQKGLSSDLIEQSLDGIRRGELERALQVLIKRYGPLAPPDATERARRARFLASRGFAADVVRRAVEAKNPAADEI